MKESGEEGALVLLDDAVHLVRRGCSEALSLWLLGGGPFVLALIYGVTDLQGPLAAQRVVPATGLLAVLYLWMKTWQALYAEALLGIAAGQPRARLSLRHVWRTASVQATWQPTGLLVLPVAGLLGLPFAWVYAFYQNLAVTSAARRAAQLARAAPRQNHLIVANLTLLAVCVFLNLLLALLLAPGLARSLLGWETALARSPWSLLNSTTLVAAAGLSYLGLGPVVRAAYVLRCFRAAAWTTGEDLQAELAGLERRAEDPA